MTCPTGAWSLSGDLALRFESEVELLAAGDVYYCPAGPPGHQFQVADTATTIDYTPASALFAPGRKAEWRSSSSRQLRGAAVPASRGARPAQTSRRPDASGDDGPTPKASVEPAPIVAPNASVARWLRRSGRTPVWVARDPLRPAGTRIG